MDAQTIIWLVLIAGAFLGGLLLGALLTLFLARIQRKQLDKIVSDLSVRDQDRFAALSLDALQKATDQFVRVAGSTLSQQTQINAQELDGKKALIDQSLGVMNQELSKVQGLVGELERQRQRSYGEVSEQLRQTAEQTGRLQETTRQLQMALANTRVRGSWGERMAEDVLRMAGFIEGINYVKQQAGSSGQRPDFSFLLPRGLKVHMDVKFPLDNYLKYLAVEKDGDRKTFEAQFLKDVRSRIREVTAREYINRAEHTVDYMIIFIPNEQIFAFISERDARIWDEALANKVILCSPFTLFAVLAVIHQAVDNFYIEERATQILAVLSDFRKQWGEFVKGFDDLGAKMEATQKEYEKLTGRRRNSLEKHLARLDELRQDERLLAEELPEYAPGEGAPDMPAVRYEIRSE